MTPSPPDPAPHAVANANADGALTVADALRAIRAAVAPVAETEALPLATALDRVLADDIASPIDVPPQPCAAMDGWAFRHADVAADPARALQQVGAAFAGHPFDGSLHAGQCVRVMTGAMVPAGADCVAMQEVVRVDGDGVHVPADLAPGQNVRRRGEDLAQGEVCVAAGTLLRPAHLGLLASVGCADVRVRRRLRVAFFSTGDELVEPGAPLPDGAAYDANRVSLRALLQRLGCELHDFGLVRDDPAALQAALAEAAIQADIVLTSGGVSVGEADHTRRVLAELGAVAFWKIAMRPGRPLAFGRVGRALFFGLPGNPVAVMVAFQQFVREAILRSAGVRSAVELPLLPLPAACTIRKKPGRTEYVRGVVARTDTGTLGVRPTAGQGAAMLRSMTQANCLIVLEHARGDVAAGESVDVLLFEGMV
jgi:molybdopterin molybdotransferase